MAIRKKTSSAATGNIRTSGLKVAGTSVIRLKDVIGKLLILQKISSFLSIIFYIIWIIVGIFFVWFIFANFRAGAFDQLMRPVSSASGPTAQNQQTPEETTIPGVGTVNVACVQSNLSEDLIVKMVRDQGTSNFSDEEKAKLAPCVVEAETQTEADPSSPKQ